MISIKVLFFLKRKVYKQINGKEGDYMVYPPKRYFSDNLEKYFDIEEIEDNHNDIQAIEQEDLEDNVTILDHYLIKEGILPEWI